MAGYSIAAIAEALAAAVHTVAITDTVRLRALAYIPKKVTPPMAVIKLEQVDYDESMGRGVDRLQFVVHLLVSQSSDRGGQKALYDLLDKLGPRSIKEAVQARNGTDERPHLDGTVFAVTVGQMRQVGEAIYGEVPVYGAEIEVECFA